MSTTEAVEINQKGNVLWLFVLFGTAMQLLILCLGATLWLSVAVADIRNRLSVEERDRAGKILFTKNPTNQPHHNQLYETTDQLYGTLNQENQLYGTTNQQSYNPLQSETHQPYSVEASSPVQHLLPPPPETDCYFDNYECRFQGAASVVTTSTAAPTSTDKPPRATLTRKQEVFLARVEVAMQLLAQSVLGECLNALSFVPQDETLEVRSDPEDSSVVLKTLKEGFKQLTDVLRSARNPRRGRGCVQQRRSGYNNYNTGGFLPRCQVEFSRHDLRQLSPHQQLLLPGIAQELKEISNLFRASFGPDEQRPSANSQIEYAHAILTSLDHALTSANFSYPVSSSLGKFL